MVQANLYSYFFNRPYKRVEFLFKDTLEKRSVFRKTDRKAAEVALNLIDTLLRNKVSAIPPKKYKCVACEFRSKCTVRNK
jgi:CRISPR/Cas system-associated exonuclease Cas4 (RecB family)